MSETDHNHWTIHTTAVDNLIGVYCNNCGRTVRDIHYRCVECKNFDLCPDCAHTMSDHPHYFILTRSYSLVHYSYSKGGYVSRTLPYTADSEEKTFSPTPPTVPLQAVSVLTTLNTPDEIKSQPIR